MTDTSQDHVTGSTVALTPANPPTGGSNPAAVAVGLLAGMGSGAAAILAAFVGMFSGYGNAATDETAIAGGFVTLLLSAGLWVLHHSKTADRALKWAQLEWEKEKSNAPAAEALASDLEHVATVMLPGVSAQVKELSDTIPTVVADEVNHQLGKLPPAAQVDTKAIADDVLTQVRGKLAHLLGPDVPAAQQALAEAQQAQAGPPPAGAASTPSTPASPPPPSSGPVAGPVPLPGS